MTVKTGWVPPDRPRAHPVSCTMSNGSLPGVKWSGCGADHAPPSNTGLRIGRSRISTIHLCLHREVMELPLNWVKNREQALQMSVSRQHPNIFNTLSLYAHMNRHVRSAASVTYYSACWKDSSFLGKSHRPHVLPPKLKNKFRLNVVLQHIHTLY